ncbi:MAG TPA: hypothetical protein QGH10_11675 [Armatimonadota bacterium]|nr:hypothetical protein [Armatimonadota bacterium]
MKLIRITGAAAILLGIICVVRGDTTTTAGVKPLVTASLPAGIAATDVANPAHAAWEDIEATPIHVNRTPPLYSDDKNDDGERPTVTAKAGRLADGQVVVLIHWTDADANIAPDPKAYADAGEEHVYQEHSESVDEFADAACAMVPRERAPHRSYPSIMMGDGTDPVDLYFWQAGVGFAVLKAAGMATVESTDTDPVGKAARDADGWTCVMLIGDAPPQTPVCFGVWDGAKEHRDGLKFFSLWYEVQ